MPSEMGTTTTCGEIGYWDIRPQLEMVSLVPTQQWSLVVYKWKGYEFK